MPVQWNEQRTQSAEGQAGQKPLTLLIFYVPSFWSWTGRILDAKRALAEVAGTAELISAISPSFRFSVKVEYPHRTLTLANGTHLGPYEILSALGAGGMGEVYRARDTRLERTVAIKVLPSEVASQPQLRERFEREARAISALSHPNICSLYDIGSQDGITFLVMEYIEGVTLADRIGRGPLPLEQALAVGIEIASALDHAHRQGITHRDLKPGNIMLTKSGSKLLDFGLAKLSATTDSKSILADAPTVQRVTAEGTILGTLQYMSPEQLEAKPLDGRSDVFAFGAVLYEMVTGRRAFDGPSQASIVGAILHEQPPPIEPLNAAVPRSIERVIRKSLAKDPDERWQSAGDLADELRWIANDTSSPQSLAIARKPPKRMSLFTVLALAAVAGLVAGHLLSTRNRHAATPPLIRFSINPPQNATFAQGPVETQLALSPDGKQIAFVAVLEGKRQLWLRSLDSLEARKVSGTDGSISPFWSADGRWIGFFADASMKKVPFSGGPVQTICKARGGTATWNRDGRILFAEWGPTAKDSISMIADTGGPITQVTSEEAWYFWPSFLPDGRHFLVTSTGKKEPGGGALYIGSIDSKNLTLLLPLHSRAEVNAAGDLVYVREGSLVVQKLDLEGLKVKGESVPIAEGVFSFWPTAAANFSVAMNGEAIAYQRAALPTQLTWTDRNGREISKVAGPAPYRNFALSPDETRLALDLFDPATGSSNLWLYELGRSVTTRLTSTPVGAYAPVWARDGRLVASVGDPETPTVPPQLTIFSLASGEQRRVARGDGLGYATDVTRDGSGVIYTISRGEQFDIEMRSTSGDRQKTPIIAGPFDESGGTLSPDNGCIAFVSDESGRPEVYVRPFRKPGEKIRISVDGGSEPRWRGDGRELFYLSASGILMSVPIQTTPSLRAENATSLFPVSSAGMMELDFGRTHYVPGADGKRILVRTIPGSVDDSPVALIVNWRPETKGDAH